MPTHKASAGENRASKLRATEAGSARKLLHRSGTSWSRTPNLNSFNRPSARAASPPTRVSASVQRTMTSRVRMGYPAWAFGASAIRISCVTAGTRAKFRAVPELLRSFGQGCTSASATNCRRHRPVVDRRWIPPGLIPTLCRWRKLTLRNFAPTSIENGRNC